MNKSELQSRVQQKLTKIFNRPPKPEEVQNNLQDPNILAAIILEDLDTIHKRLDKLEKGNGV